MKFYLDKQGKTVQLFKNNFPGIGWALLFLKRLKDLTMRVAANIEQSRAKVSQEAIKKYFSHLEKEAGNVPPTNIRNFDETNFSDDPGNKVLTKQGCKYPERMNTS